MDENQLINFLRGCDYTYKEKGLDENLSFNESEKIEFMIPNDKFECWMYAPTFFNYSRLVIYEGSFLVFQSKQTSELFYEIKERFLIKKRNDTENKKRDLINLVSQIIKGKNVPSGDLKV